MYFTLKIAKTQKFSENPFIFAIFPIMILFFFLKDLIFSEKVITFKWNSFLVFFIACSLFGLAFFMQYHRLRFKKVSTTISIQPLHEIIKEIGEDLNWDINLHNYGAFASTNPPFWSGSWGEEIKIFIDKENSQVLINSICRVDKQSSVFAFGRNRKNEQRLIKKIKEYEAKKF